MSILSISLTRVRDTFSQRLLLVVIPLVTISLYLLINPFHYQSYATPSATHNSTLGFGATILISLPSRSDRRDAVSLLTSLSDITITHQIEATRGQDVADKAKPAGAELDPGNLGAWRSHMDALRWIVDNKIQTALILEDDVDWDYWVKDQMQALSKGLQEGGHLEADAPYGMDWDTMHLGTSLVEFGSQSGLAYEDRHRNPNAGSQCSKEMGGWYCWDDAIASVTPNLSSDERFRYRVIAPSYRSVGLAALAVTYHGAQRLLYHLSWQGINKTLDWDIAALLQQGELQGWTVLPPIMSSWKVGGPGDSDLINNGAGPWDMGKQNRDGDSPGLAWSVRKSFAGSMSRSGGSVKISI